MKLRIIALLCLLATTSGCGEVFGDPEETEARGERIVAALRRYHLDHGVFPDSLNQLVPDYLDEVEPPTWGTYEWDYAPYRGPARGVEGEAELRQRGVKPDSVITSFDLAAPGNEDRYPIIYYSERSGRWGYDN